MAFLPPLLCGRSVRGEGPGLKRQGIRHPQEAPLERFVACFTDLSDARASNARRHDFHALLIIALCTALCGGQTSVDMALHGGIFRGKPWGYSH